MTTTLEIDLLRTLSAIADTGSFGRAAARVHRSQSAVSMQMKRLEELVDRSIFAREGRRMRLTNDGKSLVAYASRLLAVHDEAVAYFAEPALSGNVRLGTPDDYAANLLPVVLSRFGELYPNVHVEVRCGHTRGLRAALDDGELDLALLSRAPGEKDGLVLLRDPLVWVAAPDQPTHRRDPMPLAVHPPPSRYRQWVMAALDAACRPYRIAYTSSDLLVLQGAVSAGLAVAAIARSSNTLGLRELGPRDGMPALPEVTITLVTSRHGGSPASRRLAEEIAGSLADREVRAPRPTATIA